MKEPVAKYIDHTLLKPVATSSDILKLCREAVQFGFAAVCIPPFLVNIAAPVLTGSGVKTATVIGFPMGYSGIRSKITEIEESIEDGADELDVVINLIALKNGDWSYLEKEMQFLAGAVHEKGKIIKVIVESGILTKDELYRCCDVYGRINIDFMKTSTGYAEKGAAVSDVITMRNQLPASIKIKASGGIRHYSFAAELIGAGADRLGCSSGLKILEEERQAV